MSPKMTSVGLQPAHVHYRYVVRIITTYRMLEDFSIIARNGKPLLVWAEEIERQIRSLNGINCDMPMS